MHLRMRKMLIGSFFRLDPALIRPGRIDVQSLISYCAQEQVQRLFQNFYPEADGSQAENFINRLQEVGLESCLSPASLQGHFLLYKNSPEDAILHADEIHGRTKKRTTAVPFTT